MAIKKLVGAQPEHDEGAAQAIMPNGSSFTFKAVGLTDEIHAVPPVYFCSRNCKRPVKVSEVKEGQLSVSSDGDYLLITEEYTGRSPRIYDSRTGKLVFSCDVCTGARWEAVPLEKKT